MVHSDKTPVRDWLEVHPRTTVYIAIMVTLIFIMEVLVLVKVVGAIDLV